MLRLLKSLHIKPLIWMWKQAHPRQPAGECSHPKGFVSSDWLVGSQRHSPSAHSCSLLERRWGHTWAISPPGCHVWVIGVTWVKVWLGLKLPLKGCLDNVIRVGAMLEKRWFARRGKSVYIWSEWPHLKVEWKAGRHVFRQYLPENHHVLFWWWLTAMQAGNASNPGTLRGECFYLFYFMLVYFNFNTVIL